MPSTAPTTAPTPPEPDRKAAKAAQKAQAAQEAAQEKADRRAQHLASKAQAKTAKAEPAQPQPAREPVFAEATKPVPVPVPVAPPAPTPIPPLAPPPPVADTPVDGATPGHAIIVFANVPGPRCGTCETLKISVQPSGKVLVERGYGAQDSWRYRRSLARTRPDRAAAFAARLAALRPVGKQEETCPAPTTRDQGITVEWIEGDRHDQLSIAPGCGGAALATLMHAPDLLDLRQLAFPWDGAR